MVEPDLVGRMNDNSNSVELMVDVLCLGIACYDLIFSVDRHIGADEKIKATGLTSCGGGIAANASMTVARLGYSVAFAGYLGRDMYGDKHPMNSTPPASTPTLSYAASGRHPSPPFSSSRTAHDRSSTTALAEKCREGRNSLSKTADRVRFWWMDITSRQPHPWSPAPAPPASPLCWMATRSTPARRH